VCACIARHSPLACYSGNPCTGWAEGAPLFFYRFGMVACNPVVCRSPGTHAPRGAGGAWRILSAFFIPRAAVVFLARFPKRFMSCHSSHVVLVTARELHVGVYYFVCFLCVLACCPPFGLLLAPFSHALALNSPTGVFSLSPSPVFPSGLVTAALACAVGLRVCPVSILI